MKFGFRLRHGAKSTKIFEMEINGAARFKAVDVEEICNEQICRIVEIRDETLKWAYAEQKKVADEYRAYGQKSWFHKRFVGRKLVGLDDKSVIQRQLDDIDCIGNYKKIKYLVTVRELDQDAKSYDYELYNLCKELLDTCNSGVKNIWLTTETWSKINRGRFKN